MESEVKEQLIARVERALESIRPFLEADGGNIAVVDINDDMELQVMLTGSCETCPMSNSTMKGGVEGTILSAVPEIKKIISI